MSTVTIREAQASLSHLIEQLRPGEEVVITDEHHQPVARLLLSAAPATREPRELGTLRGTVQYVAPDFDAPLDDFKEYME